jgi:hypothetical protein
MVAKVNSGKNIVGILNYNEKKVREGLAKCIHENLFGRDVAELSFSAKLKCLENFSNRNRRATTKAVHISLNFHSSEKLNESLLVEIASTYMDKIGFADQPYLVYQHFDAAHPHIHIITTNIKQTGQRIILYNIGRNQSEKARKEIEEGFRLVKASGRKQESDPIKPVDVQKVIYGKAETKRTISNVVRFVVRSYKYTSLPELNAVLSQYNLMADTGSEGSQMNLKKGLLYRLVDDNGKKVGVPIKASSIYGKPTLLSLEKQFKLNEALRSPHKNRLKKCVEVALNGRVSKGRNRMEEFKKSLADESISVVFRKSKEEKIYGITFVDNKTKAVFNGSDLGKTYSAKAIMERLDASGAPAPRSEWLAPAPQDELKKQAASVSIVASNTDIDQVVSGVITAEAGMPISPDAAMRRRKKKRKKRKSL